MTGIALFDINDIKQEAGMTDLLIRNIDPDVKRDIEERAKAHDRSLSDEAKAILHAGLRAPTEQRKMGTWMRNLVPPEYRGDDLVFEVRGPVSPPPDFD